jgi:hypothetical protein
MKTARTPPTLHCSREDLLNKNVSYTLKYNQEHIENGFFVVEKLLNKKDY